MAWSQRSSYDPAAKQKNKPRESIVDFALKQINPQNTDYGCRIDEARKLAVDETVRNIDSWAAMIAFTFLVLAFMMVLHQNREGKRRESIAAEFLAQYHNAWVDARAQAAQAIRRYNDLVDATNSANEAALRSQSPDLQDAPTRAVTADSGRDGKPHSATASAAGSSVKAGDTGARRNDAIRPNREPEPDLIAQISTLQEQLRASNEREKNLQKELNKAKHRAPAVQPRDENQNG